jgi:hypothetical protein
VIVAHTTVRIVAGAQRTVKLTLNAKGRADLKAAGRKLKAGLLLLSSQGGQTTTVAHRSVAFLKTKPKK